MSPVDAAEAMASVEPQAELSNCTTLKMGKTVGKRRNIVKENNFKLVSRRHIETESATFISLFYGNRTFT